MGKRCLPITKSFYSINKTLHTEVTIVVAALWKKAYGIFSGSSSSGIIVK